MDISRIHNHPAGIALAAHYDTSEDRPGEFEKFVAISVALTGFSEAELRSTGLVRTYFDEMALIIGRTIRGDFLDAVAGDPANALKLDPWRPLGQNLVRMWYVGQWKAMPPGWATTNFAEPDGSGATQPPPGYNEFGRDTTRVLSAAGYQEGLVWRAIGVNPPGAKQPGFASWARGL
ncbi:hypothetical protein [Novosphingobium sp.]|uniref:hypothetical protein n=1 Tax=Novosphingobium sp. TaxID=1874826 RepID=UPI003B52CCB3